MRVVCHAAKGGAKSALFFYRGLFSIGGKMVLFKLSRQKRINRRLRGLGLLLTAGLSFASHHLVAQESASSGTAIEVDVLAKSTVDWRGNALPPYAEGKPEVTVAKVTIPAGQALPLHQHPFMTAGVVVKGTIEVRTDSGDTHIARAGDAVIELINQAHGGANIGDEDAVILVVYAGIEGEPVTVPLSTP